MATVKEKLFVTTTRDEIRKETETNHRAFRQLPAARLTGHEGEFALMKGGALRGFYQDDKVALQTGRSKFVDRLYSIHRVPGSTPAKARVASGKSI